MQVTAPLAGTYEKALRCLGRPREYPHCYNLQTFTYIFIEIEVTDMLRTKGECLPHTHNLSKGV